MIRIGWLQKIEITRGIIIGSGRIGLHLYETNQRKDILLTRRDPFPSQIVLLEMFQSMFVPGMMT